MLPAGCGERAAAATCFCRLKTGLLQGREGGRVLPCAWRSAERGPAVVCIPPPPAHARHYHQTPLLMMHIALLSPQYGATAVALFIYAAPLYLGGAKGFTQGTQGEVTADYISSMRLLSNSSK